MSNKLLPLLVFCLLDIAYSKTNYEPISIFDNSELQDNYVKYGVEVLDMKDTSVIHRLFYNRLNLKKLEELKKAANQDILSGRNNTMGNDYINAAIKRPHVIVGTVIEEVRDTSKSAFFRLQWKVKVKEIIADDGKKIKIQNGEEIFIKSTGLVILCGYIPRLSLDEEVVMSLSPIRNIANRRFISSDEDILTQFNIERKEDIENTFTIAHVLSIREGNVWSKKNKIKVGKLNKVKKQIKQIIKINNRNQFYSDFRD